MLNNSTISKLHEMKLSAMAKALENQHNDTSNYELSFDERIGLIVDAEYISRKNNRLKRLISNADYSIPNASTEDIEYHADRKLDKSYISFLRECTYIQSFQNVIIMGATGSGKTYLACALGMVANRNFFTVKYVRLPELLGELAISRKDGRYQKTIKAYKTVQLLIVDEWLLSPLSHTDAQEVLEIVEARYHKSSTIFCSQFDTGGWHDKIGNPTMADAICDRIVHRSHKIVISGDESMRKRKGLSSSSQ